MGKKKGKGPGAGGDENQKQNPSQGQAAGTSQPQQPGKKQKKEQGSGDSGSAPSIPQPQPTKKHTAGPGGDAGTQKQEHQQQKLGGRSGPQQGQDQQQHRGQKQQKAEQQQKQQGGRHEPQKKIQQPQQGPPGGPPLQGPPGFAQQGPPGFAQQGPRGGPQQQQHQGRGGPPGGPPQQQGAGGGPQHQHQSRGGPPGGPPQPQGAWGGPNQSRGRPPGGPPQQQGAWGGPQQHQSRGGPPGGPPQPQGAWGGPQYQHQSRGGPPGGPPQPQGAWGGPHQSRGGPPGGPPQQQGAWGGPQQHQSRGGPPGGPPQPQGAWSGPQQQQSRRGPPGGPSQQPQATQLGDPHPHQQSRGGTPQQQPRDLEVRKELPVLPRAMTKMKIDEFKPSNIPVQAGSRGKKMIIESNYLDLNINNLPNEAWQYDVVIEPDKPKKFLRLAFNEFSKLQERRNIFLAFDGSKIAFSNKRLDSDLLGGAHEIQIIEPDTLKPRKYKVTIKEADCPLVELSSLRNYKNDRIFDKPMRAVQCLDVVLRSALADANFAARAGRNFYVKPERYVDLDDGYELWLGLFQACVLGDRPLLNIDVCHKAFPSEVTLIDFIRRTCDPRRGLDRRAQENVLSLIKGIDVSYQETGNPTAKRFKCFGLGQVPSRQMFEKDGRQVSVRDYFLRDKNITLQYGDLPCVMVAQGRVALPMEFCKIPGGQAINKKAGERQVRAMIKSAATTTDLRKTKIMDLFRMFQHDMHPVIRSFKITIGRDFLKLQARILDAPNLEYAGNQTIFPTKGSWQLRHQQFIQPSNIISWAILICDRWANEFDVRRFKDLMIQEGSRLRMNISQDVEIVKENGRIEDHLNKFKQDRKDLVVVVIGQARDSYYQVKQPAEIRCGVLTQCIKGQTIAKRCNPSTVHNILLKVNAKLNGTNHKISKGNYENVMFLGADVTHPSPDQRNIPSVVGIAATHDRVGFQYNMRFRLQDPKQEMIQDMEMLFKEQLLFYKERVKALPQKIVYYRDGVSDGQFEQVRQVELNAIDRAVSQIQQGYKPLITCVICQKRHHTRFFPTAKTGDKFNNVPPGTVVDSMITHPAENQFFLVSHESIQGVAKPSKYCLIRDDSKFNIDELQTMTYNLCHMFTRCNRSVSYPAPAYYAHLAAARGRVYIEGMNCNLNKLDFENRQRSIKAEIFREKPMFFV